MEDVEELRDIQRERIKVDGKAKWFSRGDVVTPHAHSRDQLLYAQGGVMRATADRETWMVVPNSALYIPAGVQHSIEILGAVEMRTLYISTDLMPAEWRALAVFHVSILLREFISTFVTEPAFWSDPARRTAFADMLKIELLRAQKSELFVPLPMDKRLQNVCAALLHDPSDRKTLDGWAEKAGASVRTLGRLFDEELGMNFNAWRQRVRFQAAFQRLAEGEPISRVAHDSGYNSSSAFTAAYGKVMGHRPSEVEKWGVRNK